MHDAAKKACKPGETVAQNSFTETNRFPFPTWNVRRSLSFWILFVSFLTAFLLSFFSFPFLTYRNTEQGWGDREAAA
jgi:hypothetical protein